MCDMGQGVWRSRAVGVMESMGFLARGESSSQSHWVSICMSVQFMCVFIFFHISHLLNNMSCCLAYICLCIHSMCILPVILSCGHAYSHLSLCVCACMSDIESCRGYSNKGMVVVGPGPGQPFAHYHY